LGTLKEREPSGSFRRKGIHDNLFDPVAVATRKAVIIVSLTRAGEGEVESRIE
jgi:hypothetical protein